MIADLEARMIAEERRHREVLVALAEKYPNYRKHVACGRLGAAIAMADMWGVDVEGFLANLRKKTVKPEALAPGKAEQS